MTKMWYCLGGPLHGTYRQAGAAPIYERPPTAGAYFYNGTPIPTVVIPHPPVTYFPVAVWLPGWRVPVTMYVEESMAHGAARIPAGTVLPGSIQGAQLGAVRACCWCYRAAIGQMPVCTRDECISAMGWLESIDSYGREGQ